MLKACPYCKGVHPQGYVCPNKPAPRSRNDKIKKFRDSQAWRQKRKRILERDRNLCRACADGYGGEPVKYNSAVSVHHIVPLSEAWELRLEDDNLICLCRYHHELAESGKIPQKYLKNLAKSDVFPASRANLQ